MRHIASLFDATEEERGALFELLAEMRLKLQEEFHPDGFNICINDGAAAGQTVMHLHIHLILRYAGDHAADHPPGAGKYVRWAVPGHAELGG